MAKTENMSLIPTGDLSREQWQALVKRLVAVEVALAAAKDAAAAVGAGSARRDDEAAARKGVADALRYLRAIEGEIASADRQATMLKR